MDVNEVQGGIKQAAGKLQSAVGDLAGDARTQATGSARQAAGWAQKAYGQTADEMRDFASGNPLAALLTAAGVGLVVGMFLSRRP